MDADRAEWQMVLDKALEGDRMRVQVAKTYSETSKYQRIELTA